MGKAGRNFGQPTQKPEYKCLNSEQTKKLAEISASPKKNENNHAYSPGNKKLAEISARRVKNCIYT